MDTDSRRREFTAKIGRLGQAYVATMDKTIWNICLRTLCANGHDEDRKREVTLMQFYPGEIYMQHRQGYVGINLA